MAHADRKHHGPAHQGKGDGTGAMSQTDPEAIPANATLSDRDRASHAEGRGPDGGRIAADQRQDSPKARIPPDAKTKE